MTDQEMLNVIRETVCTFVKIDPEKITGDTNIRTDLGMNSLELVNLAAAIEDAFDAEIPDREVTGIETVDDVIRIIKEYQE